MWVIDYDREHERLGEMSATGINEVKVIENNRKYDMLGWDE